MHNFETNLLIIILLSTRISLSRKDRFASNPIYQQVPTSLVHFYFLVAKTRLALGRLDWTQDFLCQFHLIQGVGDHHFIPIITLKNISGWYDIKCHKKFNCIFFVTN